MKVLAFLLLIVSCVFAAEGQSVTGKWSGTFTSPGDDPNSAFIAITQTGSDITGTGGPSEAEQWPIQKGKITDGKITIEVTSPDGVVYKCLLALEGDHLKGDVTASANGQTQSGKIDLTRVK
jgi:hypothetical protein